MRLTNQLWAKKCSHQAHILQRLPDGVLRKVDFKGLSNIVKHFPWKNPISDSIKLQLSTQLVCCQWYNPGGSFRNCLEVTDAVQLVTPDLMGVLVWEAEDILYIDRNSFAQDRIRYAGATVVALDRTMCVTVCFPNCTSPVCNYLFCLFVYLFLFYVLSCGSVLGPQFHVAVIFSVSRQILLNAYLYPRIQPLSTWCPTL